MLPHCNQIMLNVLNNFFSAIFYFPVRPWSFDSWNGISTIELRKAAVGKQNWPKILKFHIFPSIKDRCHTWSPKTFCSIFFLTRPSFKNLRGVFLTKGKKNTPRIFDTSCINKFWWNLAWCIAPTLKTIRSTEKYNPWLKDNRPHLCNYPHMPTDYGHTDKHLNTLQNRGPNIDRCVPEIWL